MPDVGRECDKGATIVDEVERANHLSGYRKEVACQHRYRAIFALHEKWLTWLFIWYFIVKLILVVATGVV